MAAAAAVAKDRAVPSKLVLPNTCRPSAAAQRPAPDRHRWGLGVPEATQTSEQAPQIPARCPLSVSMFSGVTPAVPVEEVGSMLSCSLRDRFHCSDSSVTMAWLEGNVLAPHPEIW